jgi:rod shape determining protein RodA
MLAHLIKHKLNPFYKKNKAGQYRTFWECLHIDLYLFLSLTLLALSGLVILYSASNKSLLIIKSQTIHLGMAALVMIVIAQIHPSRFARAAPWLYLGGLIMLIAVMFVGHTDKGAQRWLNLGIFRFQPSELMKLAIPMMLASYYQEKEMPPRFENLLIGSLLILFPVLLTLKQPDLGTAILLASSGFSVLFFTGIRWKVIGIISGCALACAPIFWFLLHQYQRQRVLTFINPERDPLGTGYHIIQSKIAIGSGGFLGKGWMQGTQSHLQFLPEHSTDFIFAVFSEEFGFVGNMLLLSLYTLIILRCCSIAFNAQDMYSRLLAGSLMIIFFLSFTINIGMVCGLLPVVGIPLPLVSYGGTSMVTLMAGFGVLMSLETHKKLIGS